MLDQAQPEQPSGDSGSLPLEDRIADKFGGSAPDEAPEVEAQAPDTEPGEVQEETFDLDYDGAKYTLPKKLEKGFMQERDYTQKSQQLADTKRNFELKEQQFQSRELHHKFNESIADEIKRMQVIDAVLEQPVNWQTMSTDDALRYKLQLDQLQAERGKLAQSVSQKHTSFQQQQAEQSQALWQKTLEAVRQRITGWSDETAKEVTAHFRERGLTDADFRVFNGNPTYIEMAWKAMQFDQLQSKAKAAPQQAKNLKTSSSKPMSPQTKEYLNYRKAVTNSKPGSPERKRAVESRIASIFGR